MAALAEAAADSASSEVGESLSRHAWLVTNLQKVEPGTDGAVSLPGTIAGMAATILVAYVAVATHAMPLYGFWLVPRLDFSVPWSTVCSAPLSNVRTD